MDNNKKSLKIVAVISAVAVSLSCLGLLICIFAEIHSMRTKIDWIYDEVTFCSSSINVISDGISDDIYSGVYDCVEEALNKQNSIISKAYYDIGELESDNRTVPVIFTVIPKKVTDTTKVTINVADYSLEAERKDGNKFTAEIELDIFKEYPELDEAYVEFVVTDKGESVSQVDDELLLMTDRSFGSFSYLCTDYLPYVDVMGEYIDIVEENKKTTYSGHIELFGNDYDGMYLVTEINGKEAERKKAVLRKDAETEGSYILDVKDSWDLKEGDSLVLYAEIKDEKTGYTCKSRLSSVIEYEGADTYYYAVYDKDGKLVYRLR